MTLLSYEIFQTIIEQGSFAKAAQLLHLTPSAVSHSISSMEEEVGFPLFIRNKNGVQLTSAGEQISPYLQKIVSANKALLQTVSQMRGLNTGTVKLGCTNSVCLAWIPGIIQIFSEKHPQIDIQVYQGSYTDVVNWVRNGVIDIGFVSDVVDEGLPFTALYEDPLVCVAPKGYFPKSTKSITPEDLTNQPFVIQQDSCDKDVIDFLDNYHLEIRANCRILDDQSAIAMVECGTGISIMPEMVTKTIRHNLDVYPLEPEQHRTLGMITLNPEFLSPAGRAIQESIYEFLDSYKKKN